MRNISDRSCRENQNTFLPPTPSKSCRLWDNVEKCGSQTGQRWQHENTPNM